MIQKVNRSQIHLSINGISHLVAASQAFLPLAQYLRYEAHLPGTKVVCAEGDCGACTVLFARWEKNAWSEFKTLNSCIAPVYLFDQCAIITVEGLATSNELNEVQEKMRQFHGGQCGYCTPGMVCSLSGLAESCVQKGSQISEKKARNHLTGNLCRCTGYEPILQAATHIDLSKWTPLTQRYLDQAMDPTAGKNSLHIQEGDRLLFAPTTLAEALDFKSQNPQARIVSGATDLGVLHNKGKSLLDQALVLNRIPELRTIQNRDHGIWVGATASLTEVENFFETQHPEFSRLLRVFASPQIKNQGTLVGNVLNGSPIGDSIPALLVLNAELELRSLKGIRKVPLTEFYRGYKSFDLSKDEIATGVFIPALEAGWTSKYYKVSLRKDLDISAVTLAALVKIENGSIVQARFAVGGVGPTVIRLPQIEVNLAGQSWSESTLMAAGKQARSLIRPISDLRASDTYRLQVVENLFHKLFVESQQETACP